MRAKQIVAIAVLLFVAFLVVYPPLASSTVAVVLSPSSSLPVEHLYVTIVEVSGHRADTAHPSGWSSISNKSVQVDLAAANSSQLIGLGVVSLGEYDMIRVRISNATTVADGMSKGVQLSSGVFTVSVPFLVRLGMQADVLLRVESTLDESSGSPILDLVFVSTPSES